MSKYWTNVEISDKSEQADDLGGWFWYQNNHLIIYWNLNNYFRHVRCPILDKYWTNVEMSTKLLQRSGYNKAAVIEELLQSGCNKAAITKGGVARPPMSTSDHFRICLTTLNVSTLAPNDPKWILVMTNIFT